MSTCRFCRHFTPVKLLGQGRCRFEGQDTRTTSDSSCTHFDPAPERKDGLQRPTFSRRNERELGSDD